MHILCTICSDLLNQAENIHVTKCGHMFHYDCLHKWITRSKSCPQCRHKVTEQCMFRLYPTISNESAGVDATTLQSKLDDALFKVRESTWKINEKTEKLAESEANLKTCLEDLAKSQKRLEAKEGLITGLAAKLEYLKVENQVIEKLKEKNETLIKKINTMAGLKAILHCGADEVDRLLGSYSDVETIATFAAALKRALCDTENKKNESRDQLHAVKQQLAEEKERVTNLQQKLLVVRANFSKTKQKYKDMKCKRKAQEEFNASVINDSRVSPERQIVPCADLNSTSVLDEETNSNVDIKNDTENSDSPYLNLRQSNLALTSLQRHKHRLPVRNLKPSEYAIINLVSNATSTPTISRSSQTSIFHTKIPSKIQFSQDNNLNLHLASISYDGLGGHSKLDTFPVTNTRQPQWQGCVPKLSAKHRLKRPNPVGNQDISKMLEKKSKTSN